MQYRAYADCIKVSDLFSEDWTLSDNPHFRQIAERSESYMFSTDGSCLNIRMDNGKPIFQFMSTEEAVKRIVSKGFIVVGYPAEIFIKND